MLDDFYRDGLYFSCTGCSHCCRHESGFVYLSEKDLTKLLDWFNLERDVFIQTYCRWVPFYDGTEVLSLKETEDFDCILWKDGCSAYQARPVQCSTYPFWGFILRDKWEWKKEALECPGINQGEFHSYSDITLKREQYSSNSPIRRNN